MHILWQPEYGTCSWCNNKIDEMRGHSKNGRYIKYCIECWNSSQDRCILDNEEWVEKSAYVFTYEESEYVNTYEQESCIN